MRLRLQLLGLGLGGALVAALVGGIGLAGAQRLAEQLDASVQGAAALQASQNADMMHDAIRADVLEAQLGALRQQPQRVAEVEAALQVHVRDLQASMQALQATGDHLPAAVAQRLRPVEAPLQAYVASAQAAVKAARGGTAEAAEPAVREALAAFGALEGPLEALSEAIVAHDEQVVAEGRTARQWVIGAIGTVLALGVLAMIVGGTMLAGLIARPVAEAVTVADALAQGRLDQDIRVFGNDETRRLLQAMTRMQHSLAGIVHEVKQGAAEVASASLQISEGNQDLAGRTSHEASALEQTAATMRRVGEAVRVNAEHARQAAELAGGASTVARDGGAVMGQVVQTMQGIQDSSRRIADIIGTIDGIAFQTNILALNAAVEAARAGEQGRGFAVVASEVRTLAQRSATAAREIKQLVTASVERVEHGTSLVDQAGRTMEDIVQAIQQVSDIVGEISGASVEQQNGVEQVGLAVTSLDQSTQQNAALVEESAAAAESLNQRAQALVGTVAAFRVPAMG